MSEQPSAQRGSTSKIRVHAAPADAAEIVKRLSSEFEVVRVSRQIPDHGPSGLVRVYVVIKL